MGEATHLSPLAAARVRRRLSLEEAAARAGLDPDCLTALEQGRLYRFERPHDAVAALLLYTTALGIGRREALGLAGIDAGPRRFERLRLARLAGAGLLALAVAAVAILLAGGSASTPSADTDAPLELASRPAGADRPPATTESTVLPARAEINVEVLNGSHRARAAGRFADRLERLGYRVADVRPAPRSDYPFSRVYHAGGLAEVAARLADDLGVATAVLPGEGGSKLVLIVGRRDSADTSGAAYPG